MNSPMSDSHQYFDKNLLISTFRTVVETGFSYSFSIRISMVQLRELWKWVSRGVGRVRVQAELAELGGYTIVWKGRRIARLQAELG